MNLALGVSQQLRDVAESLGALQPEKLVTIANGPKVSLSAKQFLARNVVARRSDRGRHSFCLDAIDPGLACANLLVDLDCLVKLLRPGRAFAPPGKCSTPVIECFSLFEGKLISNEDLDRSVKLQFRAAHIATGDRDHRLSQTKVPGQPSPVLASG